MRIDEYMDLRALAERMGDEADIFDASYMRNLLLLTEYDDTATVPSSVWQILLRKVAMYREQP